MAPKRRLGEMLLSSGIIDEVQLRSAMGHQKQWGGKLGSALVELGFTTEDVIAKVLQEQLKQQCLGSRLEPDPEALKLVSREDAIRFTVMPLKADARELVLAMSNPFDLAAIDEIGFKVGKKIRGVLAVESCLKKSIKKYYGDDGTGRDYKVDVKDFDASEAEIIHYGNSKSSQEPTETNKESRRVEPSPDLIAKAVAYLLIEKGIIKREELIEKMKFINEKS